jgi:hypothetical protein
MMFLCAWVNPRGPIFIFLHDLRLAPGLHSGKTMTRAKPHQVCTVLAGSTRYLVLADDAWVNGCKARAQMDVEITQDWDGPQLRRALRVGNSVV